MTRTMPRLFIILHFEHLFFTLAVTFIVLPSSDSVFPRGLFGARVPSAF